MSLTFKKPKKTCEDRNCPFHGSLSVRGRVLDGVVVSAKMDKTVVVEREYLQFSSKFVRYERRHGHIPSHNPPCIDVKEGERVRIAECRPVSKTVCFRRRGKVGGEVTWRLKRNKEHLSRKGMLAHGQKISRGLLAGSALRCTDNTGARMLRLIQAMGYKGQIETLSIRHRGRQSNGFGETRNTRHEEEDFPSSDRKAKEGFPKS